MQYIKSSTVSHGMKYASYYNKSAGEETIKEAKLCPIKMQYIEFEIN